MNQTLFQSFDYDPEQFKTLRAYQKFLKKKIKKGKHLPEKITTEATKVIDQIENVLTSKSSTQLICNTIKT